MDKLEAKLRELGLDTISYEPGYFEIEALPYSVKIIHDDCYVVGQYFPSGVFKAEVHGFEEALAMIVKE